MGQPAAAQALAGLVKWALLRPTIYLDTMALSAESATRFDREWRRFCPTLLFGHAHSLYQLAWFVEEAGLSGIRPRA